MAQHDMNIANQSFPATRTDINNALAAIVSGWVSSIQFTSQRSRGSLGTGG